MLKEILADGERALVIAQRRRGAGGPARRAAARRDDPGRRLPAARRPRRLRLREGARSPRSRSSSSKRSRTSTTRDRRPDRPDRRDPRRGRAALPAPRAVHGAPAQAAQGRAALRPARLRQDADRQGGRELAGQEGRREDRPGGEVLLPQHQGPRAAQQVRRRDRAAHPAGLPAGPREGQQGTPVIVFFDEMDSLFRTRGSGVSSDVENTIVPQLLSEIDGVETLENVLVIGASNREDMIDPAILRPGRLDVKIKIERPGRRVGPRHLQQVPHRRPAAARRRPRRVRRRPRRVRRPG